MQRHGYKDSASIYDLVNQKKDYAEEAKFLNILFRKSRVNTVLDVGCGTGTHMKLLEEFGFECTGIDLNPEMLKVAKGKVKGHLTQADMTNFSIGKRYDAIICMFAAFNHLLLPSHAVKAINCFKRHLNKGGILLIDLHNPQGNGRKEDIIKGITRKMEWKYDPKTRIEKSTVVFNIDGKDIEDSLTMRIYIIDEIVRILREAGFSELKVYEGYGFETAQPTSKNLEVFARLS